MKKMTFGWLILTFLATPIISATSLYARNPPISIDLKIGEESEKPCYFHYGEKIPASVQVINKSQHNILISKGFKSKNFCKEMRVIDPAGRLLIPKRSENGEKEFPDAPPLPFFLYKNKPVQVAPCEVLKVGRLVKKLPDLPDLSDLGDCYDLELPGFYSAQVQVSAMIFRKDICSVKDYLWQGVLSSETIYFYFEGTTKIRIIPYEWSIRWKNVPLSEVVKVQIYYEAGKTWKHYDLESIRLNHRVVGKVEKQQSMLTAYFNAQECIKTIDSPKIGKEYPVVVSGYMRNRKPFGGGQKIRIVP